MVVVMVVWCGGYNIPLFPARVDCVVKPLGNAAKDDEIEIGVDQGNI